MSAALDGVWVVIAAHQEARVVAETVRSVRAVGARVLVVDDGSTDGTAAEAERAGAEVLRHPVNQGQGAALRSGFARALAAGAELLVSFDADGQHDPSDLPALVAPIREGRADVVLGSRFLGGGARMPPVRRLVIRGGVLFTRLASGVQVTDTHNGLRAFSRAAASRLEWPEDRAAHASAIFDELRAHRLRYVEVPVRVRYTAYSIAKGPSSLIAFRIVWDYGRGRLARRLAGLGLTSRRTS